MGIKDAFLPSKANLTGISKSESLFISRAMHKAEIVVNEEGTEASAITCKYSSLLKNYLRLGIIFKLSFVIQNEKFLNFL